MKNAKWVWLALVVAMSAGCGGGAGGGGDDEEVCNGDGRCTGDETENNCPEDCEEENPCGNNVCDAGETAQSCAQDCRCGNATCDAGETQQTCAADCAPPPPACNNNGVCEATEQYATCSTDCASKLRTQNSSSYTIFYLYVKRCTENVWGPDQLGANVISPGQAFTLNGIPPGCWNFKANDSGFAHTWQTPAGVTLQPGLQYTWNLLN